MDIRNVTPSDYNALWALLKPVLRAGDTYTLARDMTRDAALAYWDAPAHQTFVAVDASGEILGTYYLRDNQAGPGDHVCNCGYVVSAAASGKGVARAMNTHSQEIAIKSGYRGMQYNAVVSTNMRAIGLWQSCGFEIVATLPGAFLHPDEGYVDAYIMYKILVAD